MKSIEELNREIVQAVQINQRARELEMIDMVLKAPASKLSKRSALGLDRKHKAGSTPLFEQEQKSLF